jgi:hypothetical protein
MCGNSPDISKGVFRSGMCKFESSQVSQAVRRSEKVPLILAERPANGGLLRISRRSPGSDFGQSQSETADSLRRTFEKFPFLRDCGRRPGSICTTWPMRQCYVLWSPGRLGMKSGFSDRALRGGRWSVFGRRRSAYGPGRKPRKAGSATKPGTESQSTHQVVQTNLRSICNSYEYWVLGIIGIPFCIARSNSESRVSC